MSVSVILPAYREGESLAELLPRIKNALSGIGQPYEILVVDTVTKTDNTDEVCRINGCIYIKRKNGNNYGDAIRTGIDSVVNKYTVVMDADGSHNPDDIAGFYAEMKNGYDMIIGSRYINGGNSHNGIVLKMMSYILNITYRIFFGIKAKDISNSFRMYKTEQLKQLSLDCDNFDIVEEIIIKLSKNVSSFKLLEVPVFFDKRKYGESKRNLVKFMFSYVTTIMRLMRIKNGRY
ncbi:MAG: glycosyltransferase [Chitinispirillales bacterium]|jgi:dolichol-phosphate mannosyltransferase|nr:glycosyltransferase [Chitinispirillales bacterium]